MDKRYKDIQSRYLAELSGVMPVITAWWDRHVNDSDALRAAAFEARWPAGPVAHPYVLEIFRRYFFEVNDLNILLERQRTQREPRPFTEDDWGRDIVEPVDFVRPNDLLINDIEFIDADLFAVLQNLVFIPIGANAGEEAV